MKPQELDRSVLEKLKSSLQKELVDLQERARIKALEVEELKTSLKNLKDGNFYLWQILQSLKVPLQGKNMPSKEKTESLQRSNFDLPENGCKSFHSSNLKYYTGDELVQSGYVNHLQAHPYVQQMFYLDKKSKTGMNDDLKRLQEKRSEQSEYCHEMITDTGTTICYPNKSPPSSPHEFQVLRQVDSSSLLVWWNPPDGPGTSGYEIYVDGNLHYQVRSGSRTKALLQNLNLNGQVNLSLYAITSLGRSANPAKLIYCGGSKSVGGHCTDFGNRQQESRTLFGGSHSHKSFATSHFALPYVNSSNFYVPPCYPELAKYISVNSILPQNIPSVNSNTVSEDPIPSEQVLNNESIHNIKTVSVSSHCTQENPHRNDEDTEKYKFETGQEVSLSTENIEINVDEECEKNKHEKRDEIQNEEPSQIKKCTKNLHQLSTNGQLDENLKSEIKLNADSSQLCKLLNGNNPSSDISLKDFVNEQIQMMISALEQDLKEPSFQNLEEQNNFTNILDIEEGKHDALFNIDVGKISLAEFVDSNDINIPYSESYDHPDNLTASFSNEDLQIMISALKRVDELTQMQLTYSLPVSEKDFNNPSDMDNFKKDSLLNVLGSTKQFLNYNVFPEGQQGNQEYKILLESLSEKDLSQLSIVDIAVVERTHSKAQFLNALNSNMVNDYVGEYQTQGIERTIASTKELLKAVTDFKENEALLQDNSKKNDSISFLYLKENLSFSALSIAENEEHYSVQDRTIADMFLKMQEHCTKRELDSTMTDNLPLEQNIETENPVQDSSEIVTDEFASLFQKNTDKAEYISDFASTTEVIELSKNVNAEKNNSLHNLINVLEEETIMCVLSDEMKSNRPISLRKLNVDKELSEDYTNIQYSDQLQKNRPIDVDVESSEDYKNFEYSDQLEKNRPIDVDVESSEDYTNLEYSDQLEKNRSIDVDEESSEDYFTSFEEESEQSINYTFSWDPPQNTATSELFKLESQISLKDNQLRKYSLQQLSVSKNLSTPNYSICELKQRKKIANELEKILTFQEQEPSEVSLNEFEVCIDDVQASHKERMPSASPSRTSLVASDCDSDQCEPACDHIMLEDYDSHIHRTVNARAESSSLVDVISSCSTAEKISSLSTKNIKDIFNRTVVEIAAGDTIKTDENLQIGPEIAKDSLSPNPNVMESNEIIQIYSSKPKNIKK